MNTQKGVSDPATGEKIVCKSRRDDPLFLDQDDQVRRLSDINPLWKEIIAIERAPRTWFVKFMD